jgi:hypothetical protein
MGNKEETIIDVSKREEWYIEYLLNHKMESQSDIFEKIKEDKGKQSGLSPKDISNFFKNHSFRIMKAKRGYYCYIADLNGIDCVALYELKKAQEEHTIFPIPYIHSISPQIFMIDVNPMYIGYAKDMLAKVLTQRYLYSITTVENQLVLFLMNRDESLALKKACGNESTGRFPRIPQEERETIFPLFKGLRTNVFLRPPKIRKLLLSIIKKPGKSAEGTFFEHFLEPEKTKDVTQTEKGTSEEQSSNKKTPCSNG